ncbi:MAG: diguanylate cyclase, partial [Candidatus Limnocylindria bacterium]
MPVELTIVAVTAVVAGLLLVGITLAARRPVRERVAPIGSADRGAVPASVTTALRPLADRARGVAIAGQGAVPATDREPRAAEATLRVMWWLTVTIVLVGVGISRSFDEQSSPIFVLGAAAVVAVVIFHELAGGYRSGLLRVAELICAVALIAGLLALTGFANSPFSMVFALVAVAAALAYGPRAGLTAAILATISFAAVLYADPELMNYGPLDVLRVSVGLVATWLLAFVAIMHASRQRRAIATVLALSRTDPLTGLFNRSQLFVTLEQEVSRTRRSDRGFCVLMIDLDGLKAVNDSLGHLRGDDVLRALGNVIRHSIRTVDSAYRYGGDEFVVVLPETDIVGAFVVAEKIRAGAEDLAMSLVTNLAGPDQVTSVSIGLVSHPEDGLSAEELMTAADRAMYQAKMLGKNQISGNPRARPALMARRSGSEAQREWQAQSAVAATVRTESSMAPREDRAVAVELGPAPEPTAPQPVAPTPVAPTPVAAAAPPPDEESEPRGNEAEEEGQPDAGEVRRQIAHASRSFDPDHQIRRAMDAFLSPIGQDVERRTPDA